MKTQPRQYPKKMLFNLFAVAFLGWFILIGWSMTLWVRFGFNRAWDRLYQLSNQQRTAMIQFNDASIAGKLNALWMKLPTEKFYAIRHSISNALPNDQFISNTELKHLIEDALQIAKQFWTLVEMSIHVMLIKLTILLAAIPLFVLSMTAGLVDGLNQRAIRTASLGRESSYVFHQFNRLFKRGLIVLLGVWLAIPVSITPALMLVPVSILLSVVVSITASRFKKYL